MAQAPAAAPSGEAVDAPVPLISFSAAFGAGLVTLGADPRLREARLREAVAAGRLSADHVRALLPGPGAGSLEQVAGLLEGPGASDQERRTAERFRALAALLRRQSDEEARRREAEKARRREAEAARREEIDALVRQREAEAARREEAPKKRAAR